MVLKKYIHWDKKTTPKPRGLGSKQKVSTTSKKYPNIFALAKDK